MTLLLSAAIALVAGAGAWLLVSRDLVRIASGTILVANAANLFLLAATRGPSIDGLRPLAAGGGEADPVVQALALTAIVITFAVSALLIALVLRVYRAFGTIDLERLAEAEAEEERRLEAAPEEV